MIYGKCLGESHITFIGGNSMKPSELLEEYFFDIRIKSYSPNIVNSTEEVL